MIDALLYAVRDGIRAANIGYGVAECEIMDSDQPPARCGNFFAAVHGGMERSDSDNVLQVWVDFSVTLTMRVVVPADRVGDQQLARNAARELARKQGFYAKAEQLRDLLHMNWAWVVLPNQTPPSANDNIAAWSTTADGTVRGFCEPMRYLNTEFPKVVYDDWFSAVGQGARDVTPDDRVPVGVKAQLQFGRARRFQPQLAASGPFT